MLSTSSGVFGDDAAMTDVSGVFGKQAEVYGAYVWAYLILATALMVVVRRPDAAAASVEASHGPAAMSLRKAS
jgi:hypothetical protein